MTDLKEGAHLISPRTGYSHHGIFVGLGDVVHFTSKGKVEKVPLLQFTEGHGYSVQKYHSSFSRKEIVARAMSKLGNQTYNLLFQNCEHFVHWCIFNKPTSHQVTHASAALGLGIAELATRNKTFVLPIVPAAITGYGVFRLVKWLNE